MCQGGKLGLKDLPPEKDSFDIKFKLLEPRLQIKLWILGLDANTSKVNIAYQTGRIRSNLAYSYGGNVEANLAIRRFSTKVGVNPGNGDVDLGLALNGFRFNMNASHRNESIGFGVGYGADLLPFPNELTDIFQRADCGLKSVSADISSAPGNPLAWYKLHSDDISAIKSAVSAGKKYYKQSSSKEKVGAGLRLNYSPTTGLVIYGGVQVYF